MRSRGHSLSLFASPTPLSKVPQRRTVPANPLPKSDQTADQPRAARDLWLALHLPQFMLDALGDAIVKLRVAAGTARSLHCESKGHSPRNSSATPDRVTPSTTSP